MEKICSECKISNDLDLNFLIEISKKNCPILGIEIKWNNKNIIQMNSPSIDRVDNSFGYTKNNVLIISYKANAIKNNATLEELELLYENWLAR